MFEEIYYLLAGTGSELHIDVLVKDDLLLFKRK
jgi:hypothetical protein